MMEIVYMTRDKDGGNRMKPIEAISTLEMIAHEASKWGLEERMEACDIAINAIRENERLSGAIQEWVNGVCISQKYLSQIGELQYENDQLESELEGAEDYRAGLEAIIEKFKAQMSRMKELLLRADDEIEKYKCLWKDSKPGGCDCPKPTALQEEIEEAVAEIEAIGGGEK
jgi:chromosome segregation ATPase